MTCTAAQLKNFKDQLHTDERKCGECNPSCDDIRAVIERMESAEAVVADVMAILNPEEDEAVAIRGWRQLSGHIEIWRLMVAGK